MRISLSAAYRSVLLILAFASVTSPAERRVRNRGRFANPNYFVTNDNTGYTDVGGNLSTKNGQLYYRDVNGGRQLLYVTSQGNIIFPDGQFYPHVHNEAMAYYKKVAETPQWEGLREKIGELPGGGKGLLGNIVPTEKVEAPQVPSAPEPATPPTPPETPIPPREAAERKPESRNDHDPGTEDKEKPSRPEAGSPENEAFSEAKRKFEAGKMPELKSEKLGDLISRGVMKCISRSGHADYNTVFAINESTRMESSKDRDSSGEVTQSLKKKTDIFIDYRNPNEPEPWVSRKAIESEKTWKMLLLTPSENSSFFGREPDTGSTLQLKYQDDQPIFFMAQVSPMREQWVCTPKSPNLPKDSKESQKIPELGKELLKRLGVPTDFEHIDLKKLNERLQTSDFRAGLSRNQSLLNAVAILMSDKRCAFWDFEVVSTAQKATLVLRSGEGVRTTLNLSSPPSETSEVEWLNGADGAYRKLTEKGICKGQVENGLALNSSGEIAQLARRFFNTKKDAQKKFLEDNKAVFAEVTRKYREENKIPEDMELHLGPRPEDLEGFPDAALRITDGWGATLAGAGKNGTYGYRNKPSAMSPDQKKLMEDVMAYLAKSEVIEARKKPDKWEALQQTPDYQKFHENVKLLWGRKDEVSISPNLELRSGWEAGKLGAPPERKLLYGPNEKTLSVGYTPPFNPPIEADELAAFEKSNETTYVFRPLELNKSQEKILQRLAKDFHRHDEEVFATLKTALGVKSFRPLVPDLAGSPIIIVDGEGDPVAQLTVEGKLYKLNRVYDDYRKIKTKP